MMKMILHLIESWSLDSEQLTAHVCTKFFCCDHWPIDRFITEIHNL